MKKKMQINKKKEERRGTQEKMSKVEKTARPENAEKPIKATRPAKAEKAIKATRPANAEKPIKSARPVNAEKAIKTTKLANVAKSLKPAKSNEWRSAQMRSVLTRRNAVDATIRACHMRSSSKRNRHMCRSRSETSAKCCRFWGWTSRIITGTRCTPCLILKKAWQPSRSPWKR